MEENCQNNGWSLQKVWLSLNFWEKREIVYYDREWQGINMKSHVKGRLYVDSRLIAQQQ